MTRWSTSLTPWTRPVRPMDIQFLAAPQVFAAFSESIVSEGGDDEAPANSADLVEGEVDLDDDTDEALETSVDDRWRNFFAWLGVSRGLRLVHFHDVDDDGTGWTNTKGLGLPGGWAFAGLEEDWADTRPNWSPRSRRTRAGSQRTTTSIRSAISTASTKSRQSPGAMTTTSQRSSSTTSFATGRPTHATPRPKRPWSEQGSGRRRGPTRLARWRRSWSLPDPDFWIHRLRHACDLPNKPRTAPSEPDVATLGRTRSPSGSERPRRRRVPSSAEATQRSARLSAARLPRRAAGPRRADSSSLHSRGCSRPLRTHRSDLLDRTSPIRPCAPSCVRSIARCSSCSSARTTRWRRAPGWTHRSRRERRTASSSCQPATSSTPQCRAAVNAAAYRTRFRCSYWRPSQARYDHYANSLARHFSRVRWCGRCCPASQPSTTQRSAHFAPGCATLMPPLLARLGADRADRSRADAKALMEFVDGIEPVESLSMSCAFRGQDLGEIPQRTYYVRKTDDAGFQGFAVWSGTAWPPLPEDAQTLAMALAETLEVNTVETFLSFINATPAQRHQLLDLAGAAERLEEVEQELAQPEGEMSRGPGRRRRHDRPGSPN